MKLGFTLGDLEGSAAQTYYIVRLLVYREVEAKDNDTRAYLGFGFDMLLTVTGVDVKGKMALPIIAASTTLGSYQTDYKIRMVGFSGADSLELWDKLLPQQGKFDVDTYSGFAEFRKTILAGVKAKTLKVYPAFFDLDITAEDDEKNGENLVFAYALSSIAGGKTLDESIAGSAIKTNAIAASIRRVYWEHALIKRNKVKPDRSSVEKATKLLAEWKVAALKN